VGARFLMNQLEVEGVLTSNNHMNQLEVEGVLTSNNPRTNLARLLPHLNFRSNFHSNGLPSQACHLSGTIRGLWDR
jgi:hypothetical protein